MRCRQTAKGAAMQHEPNLARYKGSKKMRALILVISIAALAGCQTVPVRFAPLKTIDIHTIFGIVTLNFSQEEQRVVSSADQLAKQPPASKDSLLFRDFGFDTGLLPEGCQPFEDGRYGNFVFPNDGAAVASIRKKIEDLKKQNGFPPDEAAIALSIYEARAFRSLCGPPTMAKLKTGSKINGWLLNEKTVESFKTAGQGEIDVTPKIIIVAFNKKEFEGHLKPTAANVLLSKFRFEVPPNSDSVVSDPKTGSTILAYSENLQDVMLGNVTRNVSRGGVLRIFVGKTYIYLIDLYTSTTGIVESKWLAYQKYVDSFRYVGEGTGN